MESGLPHNALHRVTSSGEKIGAAVNPVAKRRVKPPHSTKVQISDSGHVLSNHIQHATPKPPVVRRHGRGRDLHARAGGRCLGALHSFKPKGPGTHKVPGLFVFGMNSMLAGRLKEMRERKQVSTNAREKRGRAASADTPDPIPPRGENGGTVTQPHGAPRQARVQLLKSVSQMRDE